MRLRYYILVAVAVLILAPLAVVHGVLRASLPQLDGAFGATGLAGPVKIERDRLGVPTITAASRVDLAYGTGFVHGQDRFFEMDLSRRLSGGELSELFGKVAVDQDSKTRLFRFRKVALEVMQQATPGQRAIVEAYARGVNAGLASLRSRPWEYWLLGAPPVPWRPEDTILVVDSMWWDLQASGIYREILRHEINARLGGKECDAGWKCALRFFYPARSEWDAANASSGIVPPASDIPGPEVLDVRGGAGTPARPTVRTSAVSDYFPDVGSNNWAVAGRLTATGSALISSDMHLGQRVPTLWYHARLRTTGIAQEPAVDETGVTLPGAPLLVAGSNGHVAWGFTNSYGDWLSVARVPCSSVSDTEVQTPT